MRILLWIRHPPYSTNHLAEAIRLGAMASALDLVPTCLFIGEGVRAWVRDQAPYLLGPPLAKMLQGIVTPSRPALIHEPSLRRRGLSTSRILEDLPTSLVGDEEVAEALWQADRVIPL
jgi:sulfur relay (sulfurtransferase) DsrF/TusC family protein